MPFSVGGVSQVLGLAKHEGELEASGSTGDLGYLRGFMRFFNDGKKLKAGDACLVEILILC